MILVDTCGWIEWLTEGALADSFASYMQDPAELLVPTTVQYELYKWVKRESDENTALNTIALADDSLVIPLSTDIALVAADLSLSHKLAFADAVIYASARKYNVELITSDDHFESLPVACRLANTAIDDQVLRPFGYVRIEVVHDHAQRSFGQPALCRQFRSGRRLDFSVSLHCSNFSSSTTSGDVDLGVPGGV